MAYNIKEIRGYDNLCIFSEDCKYYDKDGVICNENIYHNPCPQHRKKILGLKESKVKQWEDLMKRYGTINNVNEEKIIVI
jgi:hypothetical protein